MPKVTIINENYEVDVRKGSSLLRVIQSAGFNIDAHCNGNGKCGKCKVVILKDSLSSDCVDLSPIGRLACNTRVLDDLKIMLPNKENKISAHDIRYKSDDTNAFMGTSWFSRQISESKWLVKFGEQLIDVRDKKDILLGVAIDIGTTSISFVLIDLNSGSVLGEHTILNPQTIYGADLITRIEYCINNSNGTSRLQKLLIDEVNKGISSLLNFKYTKNELYHIVIATNNTMQHFLINEDPSSLAIAPYCSTKLSFSNNDLIDIGIEANPKAIFTFIPSVSSYIGGDVVAGILASDFSNKDKAIFIDIGTNGEICLIDSGVIIATSVAAGPAFEVMNIECGMRAVPGAIEEINIYNNDVLKINTIDNAPPKGICGSGLISIVGKLIENEVINKNGRFNNNKNLKLGEKIIKDKFYFSDELYISQKDIRQVQLAKSAIISGQELLLKTRNLAFSEINDILIAGTFGFHLESKDLRTLGIIPKSFSGRVHFLGNSSLEGARMVLTNRTHYESLLDISQRIRVIDLSLSDDFQEVFISNLSF